MKTVESLKVPSLAKKEKLELLNKLVEFSSVIVDIKDAIPISNFIQGYFETIAVITHLEFDCLSFIKTKLFVPLH